LVTIPISEGVGKESAAYLLKMPLRDWNAMEKMMNEKYRKFFMLAFSFLLSEIADLIIIQNGSV